MNSFVKIATGILLLAITTGCCNCRSAQKKNRQPLIGTEWQLVQLGGQSITPEEDTFSLTFTADNRVSGVGACNRLSGSYTTDEKQHLKIGPLAVTRMACPGMDREMEFLRVLESTTRYDMDGPMLLLMQNDDLKAVLQARTK